MRAICRQGNLEGIGKLALSLASDESRYLTGLDNMMDGGNIL